MSDKSDHSLHQTEQFLNKWTDPSVYRVAQKSKPLPKYQSNTKIISVSIKYSVLTYFLTSITMPDPQTSDMRHT